MCVVVVKCNIMCVVVVKCNIMCVVVVKCNIMCVVVVKCNIRLKMSFAYLARRGLGGQTSFCDTS